MARPAVRPGTGSAYATLAALAPDLPAALALTELLRQLAATTDAAPLRIWRSDEGGASAVLSWPADAEPVLDLTGPDELGALPGVALITDGGRLRGAVTLGTGRRSRLTDDARRRLRDTANCVLLVWRRDDLRTALLRQARHTDRLAGELADAGRRPSTVRDLERRRVATEIITLSAGRLGRLHQLADRLGTEPASRGPASGKPASGKQATSEPRPGVAELGALLDALIEDFRVMVRGIHPQLLQSRGPRAALAELAQGLAGRARITGAVPARIDPELGAALYHVTAAALQTLAGATGPTGTGGPASTAAEPLTVQLSQADASLRMLLTGRARSSTAALRAALTVDIDRLAALGGGVEVSVEDSEVNLRAWLPDRLEPAARAPAERPSSLPARVRMLTLDLALRYGDGPGSAAAQALVTRLDGPVRLGVPASSIGRKDWGRRLPDLELVDLDSPLDAVLQPARERPEQRVDVLLPGAGLLIRSAPWADLAERLSIELIARADLLRARSVLAALIRLLAAVPLTGPAGRRFAYELEELRAGAGELAELEALARLRTGTLDLTRAQVRTDERLLGCTGTAPHERLGLPVTATAEQVRAAAAEQMVPWRRMAENAAAGRPQREACGVIVRSCENLLSTTLPP